MRYPKGRCQDCGKVDDYTAAGRYRCAVCAAKNKESVRRYYQKHIDEKRCVSCGKQDKRTLNGQRQCALCARFCAAKQRMYYRAKKGAAGNCDPQAAKNELSTKL